MNANYHIRRPDAISAAIVGSHLALVFSPVYLATAFYPGWWLIVPAVGFGVGMNGILNLMHECAHALVFKRRRWSELLGRHLIGPLVFANFDAYRDRHWAHHTHLGEAGDTKETYLVDIRGWGLGRALLACLSTREAVRKFFRQPSTAGAHTSRAWLLSLVAAQGGFAGSLFVAAWLSGNRADWQSAAARAAVAYGVVYLYGLMSVTVFRATLRAIAEHQRRNDGAASRGRAALRNFSCTPFSRFLMGAYGFGEHYTHHIEPGIPYYQLPAATRELADRDVTMRPGKDYFAVLREIIATPAAPAAPETS
jgi:fatty acid desaturase